MNAVEITDIVKLAIIDADGQDINLVADSKQKDLMDLMLMNDLGLDSLDIITVAMSIEERLNLEIDDDIIDKWITVNDVVTSVYKIITE